MKRKNKDEPANIENHGATEGANNETQNDDWQEDYNQCDRWYYKDGHASLVQCCQNGEHKWY